MVVGTAWSASQSKTVLLTSIARKAILSEFTHTKLIDATMLTRRYDFLKAPGATFVTLTKSRGLRGCIGSLRARYPLLDDVAHNARAAAFRDPRFAPLRPQEWEDLSVEVSLLGSPEHVVYKDTEALRKTIVPGRDGIILTLGKHRATYLPQVWEQMKGFNEFFDFLCRKAQLERGCLALHPRIERYRVTSYDEAALYKRPMPNAGAFYPAQCLALWKTFGAFERQGEAKHLRDAAPRALVVPHAGYRYSGYTADLAYRTAAKYRRTYRRIVVVGPSHRVAFDGVSAARYDAYRTPCAPVSNDRPYVKTLAGRFPVVFVPAVHEREHSTEVQLPFIDGYLPFLPVVELIYGNVDTLSLQKILAYVLEDPGNLLIVSTDLSHYYSLDKAHRLDAHCLDALRGVDVSKLRRCKACGKTGLAALIGAAKQLGLTSELLDYRTSAASTGDTRKVVGYMSGAFYAQ